MALPLLDDTVSPVPASAAAATEPSGSSALSPTAPDDPPVDVLRGALTMLLDQLVRAAIRTTDRTARQSVGSAAGTRESLLLGLGQAAGISEREPKITPSS